MSGISSKNHYDILGVTKTATQTEIQTAYRKKALECHPDKTSIHGLTTKVATEKFQLVGEAYKTLSDPVQRKIYDLRGTTTNHYTPRYSGPFNASNFTDTHLDKDDVIIPNNSRDRKATPIIDSDRKDLFEEYVKNNQVSYKALKTMLYDACTKGKLNIVRYLIEITKLTVDVKINDGSFTGPIFRAAVGSGNLELVKYLLEIHGSDIESSGLYSQKGETALVMAASKGHEDILNYLILKGANLNPQMNNNNILNFAIDGKKVSIVKLLVEAGTKIDDLNLNSALQAGTLDIVQYLLQKRPRLQSHTYTQSPAYAAIASGNVALVKYLEAQENLDLFNKDKRWNNTTPLLLIAGAESGSIEMMKFLCEEKGLGDIIFENEKRTKNILSTAVKFPYYLSPTKEKIHDRLKLIKFLMEEKKPTLPTDELKKLIEDNAYSSGIEINSYLQNYLLESGKIKILLQTIATEGIQNLSLEDLLNLYNLNVIKKGNLEDFRSEIHEHIKNLQLSIQQLRDLFTANKPMMKEALFYYSGCYSNDDDVSKLELLLELGVDINSENAEGIAAIHLAAEAKGFNNKIIPFYIQNNADLSKKNKSGKTFQEILIEIERIRQTY